MISQQSIYSDTDLSDFSSALLHANSKDIDASVDRKVHVSSSEYASPANINLSSILSQIQDDGPAYAGSSKPENPVNLATNKNNRPDTVSINHPDSEIKNTELNQQAVHDYSANELLRKAMLSADDAEESSKNSIWPQVILVFIVVLVSVASLVMIYTKTNDMEATLNSYDARIKDSEASQNIELSPKITSINETLQSVQQELQHIKTEYPASLANRNSPQMDEAVAIKDNVSVLKDEIQALKSELKTVNSKLKTIDINKSSSKKIVTTKLGGWEVNLASFTNKDSAEKKAEQLSAAGLSPLLQQAMVKGEHVYRLSVGGFENRSDADLFIREAGEKYGMKNGWVRKS